MPTVFIPGEDGKTYVTVDELKKHGPYQFGRWTTEDSGNYPDRCDDCPLGDIKPATHYYEDSTGTKRVYCIGLCDECAAKRKDAMRIL